MLWLRTLPYSYSVRFALPVFAVLAASALLAAARADEGSSKEPASAATDLFAERCATCHTPPDPGFEADRIWIDQVRRTA